MPEYKTKEDMLVRFTLKTPTFREMPTFRFRDGLLEGPPNMSADLTAEQKKDTDKINDAIEYCVCHDESSLIYLVAVCKNNEMNGIQKIPNNRKIVGRLVYDSVNDQYHIQAFDIVKVGVITVSYAMRMKGHPNWYTHVPIPEEVIKGYLSSKQQFAIDKFKEKVENICSLHYIHFTGNF